MLRLRFGFQHKILTAFALAMLIVVLLVAVSVYTSFSQYRTGLLAKAGGDRITLLFQIHNLLLEAEAAQLAYDLSPDPRFKTAFRTAVDHLDRLLGAMEGHASFSSADERRPFERLAELVRLRLQTLNAVAERRDAGDTNAMREAILADGHRERMLALQEALEAIKTAELASQKELEARIAAQSQRLVLLLVAGALVTIALLAIAFRITRREAGRSAAYVAQLEAATRETALLNRLTNGLQSCTTVAEAEKLVGHFMQQLFPGVGGALYVARASRNILEPKASWGELLRPPDVLEIGECWALRLGRPYRSGRDGLDPPCSHSGDAAESVCIPMMAHGETIGLLHLQRPGLTQDTAALQMDLLENVAVHIGPAMGSLMLREKLRLQSVRDALTGLFNRGYLEETLEREVLRAQRAGTCLSVIMVDLDHFKRLNDTYGHHAGDLVLKTVARYLQDHVRGADIACRYGGEELALILPGATIEQATERAERLREGMLELALRVEGQSLPQISASFGVAAFPAHGATWKAVLQAADAALYRAKREGRNRVVPAAPEPEA